MNKGQRSEGGLMDTDLADELIAEALRSVEKHERRKSGHDPHHTPVDLETTIENIVVPEELAEGGAQELTFQLQTDDVAQALNPPEPTPPIRRAPELPESARALLERLKARTAELTRECEELQSALNDKSVEAQKHYERLVWTTAELENIKKRHNREKMELEKYGAERMVREILPVLDNLERALHHAGEADAQTVIEGVQLTVTQFQNSLRRIGVSRIEIGPGTPFDPAVHEAMMHEESAELPPNTVAREYLAGYMLQDRLLRASLVTVARPPSGRPASSLAAGAPEMVSGGAAASEEGSSHSEGSKGTASEEAARPPSAGSGSEAG